MAPFLTWAAPVAVLFFAVYPACNWLTSRRAAPWHLYLDSELSFPFVPQAVWVYLSMYLLFMLPPLFVPARAAGRVARQLMAGCVVSGLTYLLLPATLGFARTIPDTAPYEQIFRALHGIDAPHNLVPSLHVVFSGVIALACADHARAPYAGLLRLWLVVIAASTVLVHQHHLLDAAVALLLVVILRRRWPAD